MDSPTTPVAAVGDVVAHLRSSFERGVTRSIHWRRPQLRNLRRLLVDEEARLTEALAADLGKSPTEAYSTEIGFTVNEIDHILDHLEEWIAPDPVRVPLVHKPGHAQIVSEPYGVALVIAPWNYPLQLILGPLAAAIAAGNAVAIKPSELAPATSAALVELVPEYLDDAAIAVVAGGPDVAEALLAERFDTIFFTGSTTIGRKVMAAAARHLTPVTLELGGKSPAIVDRSANLAVTARRIAFGRFVNAGQTCIAPDYVLVDESVAAELAGLLATSVRNFYGDDPRQSADFGRIVNTRHAERLAGLLDAGGYESVVVGGDVDVAERYVAPTVVSGVSPDSKLMQDEIFGPILPLLSVPSVDAAIRFVNDRDKPLALYVFAEDADVADRVVAETSSGGVCVNHTLMHLAIPGLPFGGVGASGMGASHGRAGFDAFSHRKSVLHKSTRLDPSVAYPPYGRWKSKIIRAAL